MNWGILLSGGRGTRIHSLKVPKQYEIVGGKPVISYAMRIFIVHPHIDGVVVVAEKEWQSFIEEIWQKEEQQNQMHKELICVTPGENRQLSVMNAMTALKGRACEEDLVIIHDAARPNLSQEILTGLMTAAEDADGVVPVLPMKDTVYSSSDGRKISGLLNREEIYAGQAPEAFRYGKYDRANRKLDQNQIRQIHGSTEPAVMAGMDIRCIPGDEHNYKITTEEDLKRFREEMEKT